MPVSLDTQLRQLRAASEPTRLRMLAVLARGEFSVTDLTQLLAQSQPRVSRHLKLLCDSGLLLRFRERHWVYYRVPVEGEGAEFVRALLAAIDPADPTLALDQERAAAIVAQRAAAAAVTADRAADGSGAVDDLASVLAAELGSRGYDSLLYVGAAPASVLGVLGRGVRRAVGITRMPDEVQRARAVLHGQGMSHCQLQQGDLQSIPYPADGFDVVVLDRARGAGPASRALLRDAARVLNAHGRLVAVADYEALAQQAAGSNPLALLRNQLAAAGVRCSKLKPLDVDGAHLLLALADVDERHDMAA